ncbi:hypothetical protein [Burkholderia glumae]|uniref:Uncharacterized protein n=1 Tax=Burkholderia glumae TaxID=337 RepID=A0AAP9Y613_BURGL|nr:hypothetical protein [Burkholderia glumae]MCM2485612.1 hypothetical protein [Burkholderia glumae]MCM2496021.1 hypothetical protein [Burkholderia glumae]MCM2511516.1 hypothetical protein [Burkholderia glumae]MCM2541727.1 hypothetical protein [Burkholderia glumae]MCM2552694.1 hypothetical protein [Burkholderia glumae]
MDFHAASYDLAVGDEFDDLPPFHQGKIVSELMARLFDQLEMTALLANADREILALQDLLVEFAS